MIQVIWSHWSEQVILGNLQTTPHRSFSNSTNFYEISRVTIFWGGGEEQKIMERKGDKEHEGWPLRNLLLTEEILWGIYLYSSWGYLPLITGSFQKSQLCSFKPWLQPHYHIFRVYTRAVGKREILRWIWILTWAPWVVLNLPHRVNMADFGLFYGWRCEADKRYVSSQVQTAGWEK